MAFALTEGTVDGCHWSDKMNAPTQTPPGRNRRPGRNRHRNKKPDAINAVQALKQATPATVAGPAEDPLSADEIIRLKKTFEFLRENRSTLKLRVNAAEDLLLNGKREPTHRGVCQHLLAKVDKDKVLTASQRLPPREATKLLAGVIRFAPELAYVVRFLECVKASAGQAEAAAALTQALGGIDFDEASEAQIRQILELIVELFPQQEQPVFLLSLLRGAPFRKAFDRSTEGFPASLAEMLVPLRAVYQLLTSSEKRRRRAGRPQAPADPALLKQGTLLLMRVNPKNLLEFNESVRHRLFQLLCERTTSAEDIPRDALMGLFRSLRFSNSAEHEKALLQFVSLLLRVGLTKDAKGLLRRQIDEDNRRHDKQSKEKKTPSGERQKHRSRLNEFLDRLNQPQIGPIALDPPKGRDDETKRTIRSLPASGRWYPATHLHTLQRVRVNWGEPSDRTKWKAELDIWRSTLVPQVLLPLSFDTQESAPHPYVAVERLESSFERQLETATSVQCLCYLLDLCRLSNALSCHGVTLPDGHLSRFAVDANGRIWLANLLGVTKMENETEKDPTWLRQAIFEFENISPVFSTNEAMISAINESRTAYGIAEQLGCLPQPL